MNNNYFELSTMIHVGCQKTEATFFSLFSSFFSSLLLQIGFFFAHIIYTDFGFL